MDFRLLLGGQRKSWKMCERREGGTEIVPEEAHLLPLWEILEDDVGEGHAEPG